MSVVVISLSCLLTLNLDMFIIMFVCITLPHIAIVIMELSEIRDCIVLYYCIVMRCIFHLCVTFFYINNVHQRMTKLILRHVQSAMK